MKRCRLTRAWRGIPGYMGAQEWLTDRAEITHTVAEAAVFPGAIEAVFFAVQHADDPYEWVFEAIE